MRTLTSLALAAFTTLAALPIQAQQSPSKPQNPGKPRSIPEASGHQRTSTAADVERFINACIAMPQGNRLRVRIAGKSEQGRAMLLVRASLPAAAEEPKPERLRALVIGNIHAGEVEGKEALQQLMREFASGEHQELLERCDVWMLPIYNIDGNEAMKSGNRRGQNGPDIVGQRANSKDLDLNRDFIKADAKETRVLLKLLREIDPHLFVDLHTTNGSRHGYHLTYAPSLSPNVDPAIDACGRALLERNRLALRKDGFETFDYGNFATRDWDGGGAPSSAPDVRGWYTYDHRGRYGINYYGLRNRIAVLSEAYSYADFKTRIAATHAFVTGLLTQLVEHEDDVRQAIAKADTRPNTGQPLWLGSDSSFATPEQLDVLVGAVERIEGENGRPLRFARQDKAEPESMAVFRRFQSRRRERIPAAWAVVEPPLEVVQRLRWHGIEFEAIRSAQRIDGQRFRCDKKRKPKRPYQGHQELVLDGAWLPTEPLDLALGTIIVPGNQRLARLAATLLEPHSEDSLSSWNFFEAQTDKFYPVLRLSKQP
ncbi:MAG: M14 family metallopeptidase [Planctomycetota bacterium]